MKKIISILILIFFIQSLSFSQDTNTIKFFPLNVGNVWVYQCIATGPYCGCNIYSRAKAVNTININGKIYFLFQTSSYVMYCGGFGCSCGGGIPFDTLRVDSMSCNIYKYTNPGCPYLLHEIMIDSLKARLNDKVKINCGSDTSYKCSDTSSHTILGSVRQTRGFSEILFESGWGRSYAKGIGLSGSSSGGMGGYSNTTILGCVINGILYGDTSFPLGIMQIGFEISKSFSLSQNYPNPFNPDTKIKFDIPLDSRLRGNDNVSLKIFDLLGREIATLVNEKLSPGTYEVEWDASNYSSGVYFYTLKTEYYFETKRMVLMK